MNIIEKARKLRGFIEDAVQSLSIEQSLEAVELYPEWEIDKYYEIGYRLRFNGELYEVITAHKSQSTWQPNVSPSLFKKVLIENENIIPEWQQPDSTNGYKKDDKVIHNEKIWISLVDNNVWEPGVVGTLTLWAEVK